MQAIINHSKIYCAILWLNVTKGYSENQLVLENTVECINNTNQIQSRGVQSLKLFAYFLDIMSKLSVIHMFWWRNSFELYRSFALSDRCVRLVVSRGF